MFSHEDRIRSVGVVGLSSESQYTEAAITVWDAARNYPWHTEDVLSRLKPKMSGSRATSLAA